MPTAKKRPLKLRNADENFRPPLTHWTQPAPRLPGTRFVGPIANIITVSSPIREPGAK